MFKKQVHFQFNYTICWQIGGIVIASLLGSVTPHIFVGNIEYMGVKQATDEITEYFRYVDYTFIVWNSK